MTGRLGKTRPRTTSFCHSPLTEPSPHLAPAYFSSISCACFAHFLCASFNLTTPLAAHCSTLPIFQDRLPSPQPLPASSVSPSQTDSFPCTNKVKFPRPSKQAPRFPFFFLTMLPYKNSTRLSQTTVAAAGHKRKSRSTMTRHITFANRLRKVVSKFYINK